MGPSIPSIPVLLIGVVLTAIMIAVFVPTYSERVEREEQSATEMATEQQSSEEVIPEVKTVEETPEVIDQVSGILVANRVLMVILSALAGFNGVMLFLIYKFLGHSQRS